MYLAIDVGGTKTLLAAFSPDGKLDKSYRFATPDDYDVFGSQLSATLSQEFSTYNFSGACCAIPGRIDRSEGMVLGYGNLKWRPAPVKHDLEKLLKCPVLVENDAKLAGLSEAIQLKGRFQRVFYLTIGTGIGTALISGGKIDPGLADSEGGQIWLVRGDKRVQWEDLVSGRAITQRFGKEAAELDDTEAWQAIAQDLAEGLVDIIAVVQPEVVVIGGGVGAHFDKFGDLLSAELKKSETDLVPIPPVIKANRPEEAVVYGCYEFIRQTLGE